MRSAVRTPTLASICMTVAALAISRDNGELAAQSLLQQSPGLTAAWVGTPGALELGTTMRYRSIGDGDLAAVSTVFAAYGLPRDLLVGVNLAAQSPVPAGESTEAEAFVRWAPIAERADRPLQVAARLSFNSAATSVDGEFEAAYRVGSARLIGAARVFSDGFHDDPGFALAGGAVVHPLRGRAPLALAGDIGALIGGNGGNGGNGDVDEVVWSVGLQIGLPVASGTVSLQAGNAASGTLAGRSFATGRTWFGFAATIASPIGERFGVFVPREVAARAVQAVEQPAGPVVRISMREFAFVGQRTEVEPGTTVVWTNDDEVVHTASSDNGAWDSGAIQSGESWSARFDAPGTYSYHCGPHPYMRGVIVVRERA